jgi:hypothetical protein
MGPLNEWHDWLRLFNFLLCSTSVYLLVKSFRKHHHEWNTKTHDYWYALLAWCGAAIASSIEGVFTDAQVTVRLVFVTAASIVTLKGLLNKSHWGNSASS